MSSESDIIEKLAKLRQDLRDTDPDSDAYELIKTDIEDALRDLGMYDDMASGAKN